MRLLGAALLLVLALEFSPEAKAFKGKNATTIAARSKHKKESVSVPQRKVSPLGSHAEFEPLDEMERKESKMKKKSRERKLHKVEVSTKGKHFVHAEKSKHGGLNATFHEDASGESPDVRSEETSTSVKVAAKPNIDAQPTRKQEPEEQSHDSGDEEDDSVDAEMSGSGNTPSMPSSSKMILPTPAEPKPSHKAPPPPNPNYLVRPPLPFKPNFKALSSPKPNFKVPLLPKPNRKVTLSPKPNFKVPPPLKALMKLNPCVSKPVCTSSPCSNPCHPAREAGSIHQIKGAGYEGAYEVLPDGTYISTMTVHPNQLLEETSAQACCPACVGVCSLCMPQCCSQLLESSDSIPAMQPPLTQAALGLAPAMQPAANTTQPVPDEEAAEASDSGSGQPAQSPPSPSPPASAKSQSGVTQPISGPGYKGTTSVKPDGSTESTIVIGPVAPPPAPAFSAQDYLQGVTQRSACAAICPPTCSPQCTPQCCSQQETAPPPRFNPHPPPPRFPERWRERPRYEPGPPVPPPPAVPGRPIKLICAPQCMASPCAPSCPQACCTAPPQVFLPPPPQLPSPIGCQPMCTPTSCVVGCPSHCCARYEPVRHGIADMKHTIPELSKKQLRANETATKSAEGKN